MYGHSARSSADRAHFTAARVLTTLSRMDRQDRPITKRQLGFGLVAIGLVGFVAILAIDIVDVGRGGGIGPAQSLALVVMAAAAAVGLSLIPLGDAPA